MGRLTLISKVSTVHGQEQHVGLHVLVLQQLRVEDAVHHFGAVRVVAVRRRDPLALLARQQMIHHEVRGRVASIHHSKLYVDKQNKVDGKNKNGRL